MHRLLLLLLACAGCRQIWGVGDPVAGDDAGPIDAHVPDAPPDVLAPASCMTRWLTTPAFGMPQPIAAVNTTEDEDHPFVTADELSLYFTFKDDINVAHRSTTMDSFGAPMIESNLSSGATEGKVYISHDQLRAFFVSNRAGGSGGLDLDRNYLGNLDDINDQVDPHLSMDLLRLYFIPSASPTQRIAVASRMDTSQNFANTTSITELAGAGGADSGPTLTDDERVIVFASTRGGTERLYYATRATATAQFTAPQLVPQIAGTGIDGAPHLSTDGCRLYFMSTRLGTRDLFVARML